jgi:hypothetical protein
LDYGAALTTRLGEKWFAIGITNNNWVFDDTYDYTVYSRVSSFVNWIKDTISSN